MSQSLDRLTREVSENRDAVDSLVELITGLAQQIRDNATDQAALEELANSLDAQQDTIAAAVSANTSAAPVEPTP